MVYKKLIVPATILVLAAALLIPIVLTGYAELERAEHEFQAGNYAASVESYEKSARMLPWRDDLWEKAGISAANLGRAEDAIDFFGRAPALSPQGSMLLGYSYYGVGDTSSAIRALEASQLSLAYKLLAHIHGQQKDWTAEQKALEAQLGLDDGDPYAHYRLGLILSLFEPGQSLPHLMRASSLDPEFDPAVQTMRAALNVSATQPDRSSQMVTIGRALGLVRDWELSFLAFESAVQADAESAEAWAWLGEAKQQLGRDGRVELDQAVRLDHTSVIVRALRGLYWYRQQKYEQMLAEYLLAAEYEPSNPAWMAELGNAYTLNGDLAEALVAYQKAIELAPDEATYWRLLAVFCAENGVHVEDLGLPAALKAVELKPDDRFTLDTLGWLYLSTGRFATAEQTLLDVLNKYPDHYSANIHLAMTYLAQGNREAAYEHLVYVRDADVDGSDGLFAKQLLAKYFP